MAGIGPLDQEDEFILQTSYQVLQWSGRYAAPRKGGASMFELLDQLRPERKDNGDLPWLDWERFDRLYRLAQLAYLELLPL